MVRMRTSSPARAMARARHSVDLSVAVIWIAGVGIASVMMQILGY